MSIFRINKTKDYTVMSNNHLKEKEMSLKAKGLLSVMLSLPDNWDYSINGLVAISKENQTAIENTLKELKEFGYLRVDKIMPDKSKSGHIEYVYNIFEKPQNQEVEKLGVENLPLENQGVENRPQLNTNKSSTNEQNTKNKTKHVFGEYKHVRLADDEVKKLNEIYGEKMAEDAINYLDAYIEETGYSRKSHYLTIRRWVVDAVTKKNAYKPNTSSGYQKHNYEKSLLVDKETPLDEF